MNHYTLAEMTPGLTEEFTVTVTPEMMDAFRAITGDVSPIHIDADYARGRGFPGRVVYGMLGASFFSTLAGVYLPGEHCLLHGVECKFAKPIFIGDTLTVTVRAADEGWNDGQGHGCQRQRDRQRGRDQGRYHESGRQARDPRHHQGRVSEITRRKSCPIPI